MPVGVTGVTPLLKPRSLVACRGRNACHRGWFRSVTFCRCMLRVLVPMAAAGGHRDVDGSQQREDERLDRPEEELQEDEDHWHEQRDDGDLGHVRQGVHHAEEYLPGENVTEEPGRQRDDATELG